MLSLVDILLISLLSDEFHTLLLGFDIIATTGEESKDPRKSIPKAIVYTLITIIVAYVSCVSIMTLMGNQLID